MIAWNVYLGNRLIDTVYYTPGHSAQEIRKSLIEQDGYPHDIRVVRAKLER